LGNAGGGEKRATKLCAPAGGALLEAASAVHMSELLAETALCVDSATDDVAAWSSAWQSRALLGPSDEMGSAMETSVVCRSSVRSSARLRRCERFSRDDGLSVDRLRWNLPL
jgi:hypothetical protein